MTNVPLTPRQARKKLHRIVEQYGLDIGEIEIIPIELVREALRRFDIGLLPGRLEFRWSLIWESSSDMRPQRT
jgi:hypothetical protein